MRCIPIFLVILLGECLCEVNNKGIISAWDMKCPEKIGNMVKSGDLVEFDRGSYRVSAWGTSIESEG